MDCRNEYFWRNGLDIVNKVKKLEDKVGMTGPIGFDEQGHRNLFEIDIVELSKIGFTKIGSWDPVGKMHHNRDDELVNKISNEQLSEKVVRVVSKLGDPFLFVKYENFQ